MDHLCALQRNFINLRLGTFIHWNSAAVQFHANPDIIDWEFDLENGGEAVGLFRSEFLYLGRETPPDEETQYLAYREALERMEGRRVIVRTVSLTTLPLAAKAAKSCSPSRAESSARIFSTSKG